MAAKTTDNTRGRRGSLPSPSSASLSVLPGAACRQPPPACSSATRTMPLRQASHDASRCATKRQPAWQLEGPSATHMACGALRAPQCTMSCATTCSSAHPAVVGPHPNDQAKWTPASRPLFLGCEQSWLGLDHSKRRDQFSRSRQATPSKPLSPGAGCHRIILFHEHKPG